MKDRFKLKSASYLFVINNKNQILLSLRQNTGYCDNMYSFVAGHLDPDETPLECCIREAKEEADINITKNDLKCIKILFREQENHKDDYIDFFFLLKNYSGKFKNNEPEKCGELKFFDFDKLPINTIEYIKTVILNYKNNIFYDELNSVNTNDIKK